MRWQTLVAIPLAAVMVWALVAAISFGQRVGETWDAGQTSTVTNGLVMACFGGAMIMAFLTSIVFGMAVVSRIMPQPGRMTYNEHFRTNALDRPRGRGQGDWESDPVVDSYGQRGGVVRIEAPSGLRPMLPPASGAFDGMEDGDDGRYRAG